MGTPSPAPSVGEEPPTTSAPGALDRHRPGLDGLRAMTVTVVLAYHAELPWAKGAFLGISQFFTLSGFLITSILLRSHAQSGRIALGRFWTRRYRRLLPAAYLTLAGAVLFGATVATAPQVADLPGAVAASAAQVANWFFVVTDQSYVALFAAPSPVQHFWSLAVEEQFYLLMPLALVVLLRRARSPRVVGGTLAVGALASTALMVGLYERGASLDRLYYGTDTRAAELLVGAVLAVVLHHRALRPGPAARRMLAAVGLVAFTATIWAWTAIPLTDPVLWRGGFLVFALVSAALIVSVLAESGPVAAVLAWRPLAAIGRISYGVYLFHWPLFLWLTEERTGLDVWPLFALRLAITLALATASYHLIEIPIRQRSFAGLPTAVRWSAAPVAAGVVVVAAILVGQRDVPNELAGLGEAVPDAPVVAGDGVLDVLVIADELGAPLARDLEELAGRTDDLAVTVTAPFACDDRPAGDPPPEGPPPDNQAAACANWLEEWPRMVAETDPDAVLFQVTAWDADDIAARSGADDLDAQVEWTAAALSTGFDLLSANGAPIVWGQTGLDIEAALGRARDPYYRAITRLTASRSDLRRIEFISTDPVDVRDDLAFFQRRDPGDAPRVLVVGDSTSRTFGYGFERWATDTGAAVVWSAGQEGCGLVTDGLVHEVTGQEAPVADECRDLVGDWSRAIEEFDPDLVIVMSTIFDLQERRLPTWTGWQAPGEPAYDEHLLDAYLTAYDTLAARGARILWFETPCAEATYGPLEGLEDDGPLDPERVRYANDTLLGRLAEARPEVRTFDLFSVLCPDGRFVESLGGVDRVRSDGVHFSPEGSTWFAEEHGQAILDTGLG
jgi:peptidoglycan/LPS O-acetylase OafA/YrhL